MPLTELQLAMLKISQMFQYLSYFRVSEYIIASP